MGSSSDIKSIPLSYRQIIHDIRLCGLFQLCRGRDILCITTTIIINRITVRLFHSLLAQPLTAGKLPAVKAVQGDCQWPLRKRCKFPPVTWAPNPSRLRQSQPIFRPTNHNFKGDCGHAAYPNDSPATIKLGLFSSLYHCSIIFPWQLITCKIGATFTKFYQLRYKSCEN